MNIKLGQLINSMSTSHPMVTPSLTKFANDGGLPIKTTFRLNKVWKVALEEFKSYEAARKQLCETHGTLEEGADEYQFTAESRIEFDKEYAALLDVDVELPGEPFTIDDLTPRKLGSADFLSANDFLVLSWLIVDEPEPVKAKEQAASKNN